MAAKPSLAAFFSAALYLLGNSLGNHRTEAELGSVSLVPLPLGALQARAISACVTANLMAGLRQSLKGMCSQLLHAHFLQSGAAAASGAWREPARAVHIAVDVHRNQVDKALRTLKRKVIDEGFIKEWQGHQVYTKPSQENKLARLETLKRLKRRAFKEKMRWIYRRGARGF